MKNKGNSDRLVNTFTDSDCTTLEDYLSCMMANIEDGLIQSGFVPGKDYVRMDLMNQAMPFVKRAWDMGVLSFVSKWP